MLLLKYWQIYLIWIMYLSYNKNKIIYKLIFGVILILFQGVFPKIYISENIIVSVDILLIFLTFLVLLSETYLIIFLAFILGLFQDFIIHIEVIGLCSFLKSISIYCIVYLKKSQTLWSRYFKIFYLFFIYFIHFILYYYISFYDFNMTLFFLSFLHSVFGLFFFLILERIIYNSELL